MILTEEEASTKRCQESYPAAGAISPDGESAYVGAPIISTVGGQYTISSSSMATHTAPMMCIASKCMAWRWYPQLPHIEVVEGRKGYCGKAGNP